MPLRNLGGSKAQNRGCFFIGFREEGRFVWSLDDLFPYAYTISMLADQKVFTEACKLIESTLPVHRGTRKVDFLDGDMFCRYSLPSGLIHVRSDTQIDAVLVFSTINLKPILKEFYPSMLVTRDGIGDIPDIQDESGGIDVELDGFPCNECQSFHPTLTWHKKYNDYLLEDAIWVGKYREALLKYGLDQFAIEAQKQFEKRLEWKRILMSDHVDVCVVCSSPTCFYDSLTGRYICSDECHHKDGYEKE